MKRGGTDSGAASDDNDARAREIAADIRGNDLVEAVQTQWHRPSLATRHSGEIHDLMLRLELFGWDAQGKLFRTPFGHAVLDDLARTHLPPPSLVPIDELDAEHSAFKGLAEGGASVNEIEDLLARMGAQLERRDHEARPHSMIDHDDLRALVALGQVAVAFRETYEGRMALDGQDRSARDDMAEIERVLAKGGGS